MSRTHVCGDLKSGATSYRQWRVSLNFDEEKNSCIREFIEGMGPDQATSDCALFAINKAIEADILPSVLMRVALYHYSM